MFFKQRTIDRASKSKSKDCVCKSKTTRTPYRLLRRIRYGKPQNPDVHRDSAVRRFRTQRAPKTGLSFTPYAHALRGFFGSLLFRGGGGCYNMG
jgi:hypothetical protein